MDPVLLDMDPGHDDALALLVALSCLPVRGVTTVAGNQIVEKTYLNTRRILDVAGIHCEVVRGASKPLFRPLVVADRVHGDSGLDGYDFPLIAPARSVDAFSWLRQRIREEPKVRWIATGPLTNIAVWLMGHPDLREKITDITVMGGALRGGNVTRYAEFNFYVDPDAAHYVLTSGVPVSLVGLDVTHKALLSSHEFYRFKELGTPVGEMLYQLFAFFSQHEPNAGPEGTPVHDVLAVAALAQPHLFQWTPMALHVERCDDGHRGKMTVISNQGAVPGVNVATDIDVEGFFSWMWQQLEYYRK